MTENHSNIRTGITVNEGYELGNPQYLVECGKESFSSRLHRKHSCRWHISLSLIVVTVIIVLVGFLSPGVSVRRQAAATNDRKYNNLL